jgi:hypothetical protein
MFDGPSEAVPSTLKFNMAGDDVTCTVNLDDGMCCAVAFVDRPKCYYSGERSTSACIAVLRLVSVPEQI